MTLWFKRSLPFLLLIISAFIHAPLSAQIFEEVAADIGVDNRFGLVGAQGGGISVVDFNDDGWDDLSLGTEEGRKALFYENINGVFQEVDLFIEDTSFQKQILWVDFDNDDDLDLFITSYLGINRLYRNTGNLIMEDVTAQLGLPLDVEDSFGAIFGDINNDGYLDLFVSNYFFHPSRLFINNAGHFIEISDQVLTDPDDSSLNFCAAFYDHERDGDLDLYLINDKLYENDMYINEGNLSFTEMSDQTGTGIVRDAMNAGIGDINNDSFLDIYVTDSPNPGNALLKNNPNGIYDEISVSAGVTFGGWCWGGSICDFNNDGFQDIYVSSMIGNAANQNKLFVNNGDETFTTLNPAIMAEDTTESFCNSVADFNKDGLMDIFVSALNNEPYTIWQNQTITSNNYFKIKLEGTVSNRNGVGSWIELYTDTLTLFRFTHCGIAYLSQESYTNHFGIQDFTQIDSLIIRWPSGLVDKLYNLPANQEIYVVEDCPDCPDCEGVLGTFDTNPIETGNYHFEQISSGGTINPGSQVLFRAKETIEFSINFEIESGGLLRAENRDCNN